MPNAARERIASPRAGAALTPDLRPAGRSPVRLGEVRKQHVTETVTMSTQG